MAPDGPRALARRLAEDLREVGLTTSPGGTDIRAAIEQVLFMRLRAATAPPPSRVPAVVRRLAAAASAVVPARRAGRGDIAVLLLAGVHRALWAPIGADLATRRPELRITLVRAGRGTRSVELRDLASIAGQVPLGDVARLLLGGGAGAGGGGELAAASATWDELLGPAAAPLRRAAGDAAVRLGHEAERLAATLDAVRPRLAVTYDEIDAWGRLLCAVAAPRGIPVVDLPHAEAVDADAIAGAAFTAMGVFGPRAAAVVASAGVPPERIVPVGAARFDDLVRGGGRPPDRPARVVLAAQYLGGRMTPQVRRDILRAAVAATAAIGGRLEVVPHPVERDDAWAGLLAAEAGMTDTRLAAAGELQRLLPGAALLVTGWSNSVYEAVLAGVPALTVHVLAGEPPMPFAREGIAAEARSPSEAAVLAVELAGGPRREAALARARPALEAHLGPLDGQATRRTADLVLRILDAG